MLYLRSKYYLRAGKLLLGSINIIISFKKKYTTPATINSSKSLISTFLKLTSY